MVFVYHNDIDNLCIEVFPDVCIAFYVSKAEKRMTGDVWLFNIGSTPLNPPWDEVDTWENFQNSSEYCYPHNIVTPILESDFEVHFNESTSAFVIYFRGKLIGTLADHQRPGQSSFAKKDSPVANKMEHEIPRPT